MSAYKYIAAGYIDDAEKLFNDFAKYHNYDFKTFCKVWKEHKFSYIFMGRHNDKEIREFAGEIYHLTLNYMRSSSLGSQIAAIYLLYALYRSQDIISPVKIRISKLQYEALMQVQVYAIKEKVRTLHYVIDFLMKNCLDLVANCTLYGPCCSLYKDNPSKSKADQFAILSDLKQDMTIFQESNTISNLKKLHTQYLQHKNSIMFESPVVTDNGFEVIVDYEQKSQELKKVLGRVGSGYTADGNLVQAVEKNENNSGGAVEKNDIGYRRFKLKTAASEMKVMGSKTRYHEDEGYKNNVDASTANISVIKKRSYNKRVPVNERRIGRPRKYVKELATSDESGDSDFQYSFQIVHKEVTKIKKGSTGRRKASYLRNYEGPVILTSNQKPIDSYSNTSDESFTDELEF